MGDTTQLVTCPQHGQGYATFVCQHLARGSDGGFFYGADDLRPDAWCAECDRVLMEHGGEWNDASEAFAGITLLCSHCYDIVRDRNEVPFKRIKPKYQPTLEDDRWELDNAQRLHLLYPETFEVPASHELAALRLTLSMGCNLRGADPLRNARIPGQRQHIPTTVPPGLRLVSFATGL